MPHDTLYVKRIFQNPSPVSPAANFFFSDFRRLAADLNLPRTAIYQRALAIWQEKSGEG